MNFFTPKQIAQNYIETGISKVKLPVLKTLLLGILAGVFIGIGGLAATVIGVSVPLASIAKFLGAIVFPGGLTMVLLAGSELFTGNNLLVIPLLEKKITIIQLLRNWIIVYIGNFIGAFLVSLAVYYGNTLSLFSNEMALTVISTAVSKCSLTFSEALIKGICCNFLVCIAVWISFAAKDVTGKIIGLFFPIMMFVLCGFEHSVANMYYIPAGILAKTNPVFLTLAIDNNIKVDYLNSFNLFIKNLLPVTIGNIIGGSICVGVVYWYIYLKKESRL